MSDEELKERIKRMNKLLDDEQKPTDYLAIRVSFVHVTKGIFGLKDDILGNRTLIPDNRHLAKKLTQDLFTIVDEEAKSTKAKSFEVS